MTFRWVGTLGLAFVMGLVACGTDAVGVQTCRQIEQARCEQAPACGIPLEPPFHTSGSDVDACIRFYDDACLHGLSVSDPGPIETNQCVLAIRNHGCSVVVHPESDPACAWLVLTGSAADGSAADVVDADSN
jgi:hypothetical protein